MYQDFFFLSFSLFKIFFLFNSLKKTHEIKKMEVGFLYWFELDMSNTLGKKPPPPASPRLSHALSPSLRPWGHAQPCECSPAPGGVGRARADGDGNPNATLHLCRGLGKQL